MQQQPQKEVDEYSNPIAAFFGNFLPDTSKPTSTGVQRVVDTIDWQVPKRLRYKSTDKFIVDLKESLSKREWFVTGNVDPSFFDPNFRFQDPDVSVTGIEQYARGVNKLFNQQLSRAEMISIAPMTQTDTSRKDSFKGSDGSDSTFYSLLVTWRLSGRVNIGGGDGLYIKPFIVYIELVVNEQSGLIVFQEDKFSIPGWDILLSAIFPQFPFLQPPAPPL